MKQEFGFYFFEKVNYHKIELLDRAVSMSKRDC